MERMTVKRKDGRWALANNDKASPMEQMEKFPIAIARLAAYEDTGLEPGSIDDLLAAHEAACEKLGEYKALREKLAPPCYCPDAGDECAYLVHDGDDEPIERCKECPLCYVDKRRHQQTPSAPLTLEELWKMDGEPVYIVRHDGHLNRWVLVEAITKTFLHTYGCGALEWDEFGKTWQAYRRKPEEGAK